jgi:hypothetical protein
MSPETRKGRLHEMMRIKHLYFRSLILLALTAIHRPAKFKHWLENENQPGKSQTTYPDKKNIAV